MQNKYLNNDACCELEAYTCISMLKAIFSDFSNNNLQNLFTNLDANRMVNSNNFYGYKVLKPLINRDLPDLVITDVRVQLMLPDSLIIADNPGNYGMTLEEVDSPLSGNSNININHMRVYLILMYSLVQNQNIINFNEFDRSVLIKKGTKKLGNIKKFRKAIEECKNISPFILARGFRNFFTKQKEDINANTEHRRLISDLEFFFRLAKYFHNKLLKLKYRNTKVKTFISREDFIKWPKELLPDTLNEILAREFDDKELKFFDSIVVDTWSEIKTYLNLTVDF